MPDILITEFMDEGAVAALAADFDVHYDPHLVESPEKIAGLIGDARGLVVRNRTEVRGQLLEAASRLRVVGRLGVGLDNIDTKACAERGIEVRTAGAANANAVAEYVLGACLALLRPALVSSDRIAAGEWPREELVGFELAGRRLGLVGMGGIARVLADKAAALGMTVAGFDPLVDAGDPVWERVTRLDFEPLLESSDIISLHVPLLDTTRHLIGGAALEAIPDHALLINTSRGGVVDERAVFEALREGTLGGAALDVFETEPVGPEQSDRFAGVPNLILTPHVAGLTTESQTRVGQVTADNVRAVLVGGAE